MAALQDDGRIGECAIFISRSLFLAWGRGNPAWDLAPEPEPINATALVDEVGRRRVTQAQFVLPDPAGEIELPGGQRFTPSLVPTKWAHVRVVFDYEDAAGQTLREIGLYFDTEVDPALPAGQRYFTPAQIVSPGRLKVLERLANPLPREAGVRQTFEYVLPF